MQNLSWNDFGVRQLAKDKGVWGQLSSVIDPYGNTLYYTIQLGAYEKGVGSRVIEVYLSNNILLVSVGVFEIEIDTDERLTTKIDEIFKQSFYKLLMGTTKAPRYIGKATEISEEDKVIKAGLDQMLIDLSEQAEVDWSLRQTDSDPPTEGQLISHYTKELEAFLA